MNMIVSSAAIATATRALPALAVQTADVDLLSHVPAFDKLMRRFEVCLDELAVAEKQYRAWLRRNPEPVYVLSDPSPFKQYIPSPEWAKLRKNWLPRSHAAKVQSGLIGAKQRESDLNEEVTEFYERVADIEPKTVAGLCFKARMAMRLEDQEMAAVVCADLCQYFDIGERAAA